MSAPQLAPGDWKNEHPKGWIWAPSLKGGDTHVADIRGWGYLTGRGHGALGLTGDDAAAAQDAWGDLIVKAVNCHGDMLEALKRIVEVAESRAASGFNEAGRLAHIAQIALSAVQNVAERNAA